MAIEIYWRIILSWNFEYLYIRPEKQLFDFVSFSIGALWGSTGAKSFFDKFVIYKR